MSGQFWTLVVFLWNSSRRPQDWYEETIRNSQLLNICIIKKDEPAIMARRKKPTGSSALRITILLLLMLLLLSFPPYAVALPSPPSIFLPPRSPCFTPPLLNNSHSHPNNPLNPRRLNLLHWNLPQQPHSFSFCNKSICKEASTAVEALAKLREQVPVKNLHIHWYC